MILVCPGSRTYQVNHGTVGGGVAHSIFLANFPHQAEKIKLETFQTISLTDLVLSLYSTSLSSNHSARVGKSSSLTKSSTRFSLPVCSLSFLASWSVGASGSEWCLVQPYSSQHRRNIDVSRQTEAFQRIMMGQTQSTARPSLELLTVRRPVDYWWHYWLLRSEEWGVSLTNQRKQYWGEGCGPPDRGNLTRPEGRKHWLDILHFVNTVVLSYCTCL